MMFVCLGKGESGGAIRRRSPEYGDILALSPTKVKQSPGKFDKHRSSNGRMGSSFDSKMECARRNSSQLLDINDNQKARLGISKSNTLPRRSDRGKTPPPKPPRLPPKPPRLMERQVFVCENPACRKEENLLGIVELDFKSCPSCFTHYCSLDCRREHWTDHKIVCHYERVNSHMKMIGDLCATDTHCLEYLSDVARDGYAAKSRGAVLLVFLSPKAAELFLESGLDYFRSRHSRPTFSSLKEIKDTGVTSKHQKQLLKQVTEYYPTREFIVNVAIVVGKNLPTTPVPRDKSPAVIQQFKIPFKTGSFTKCLSPQYGATSEIFSFPTNTSNSRRKSL